MHNWLKMVFFMLSRDHKEISSFSCCDLLSLDEPKNWVGQNKKNKSWTRSVFKSWNKTSQLRTSLIVFYNCRFNFGSDHVIFKVSWSVQPILEMNGQIKVLPFSKICFQIPPTPPFAVQMTYLTPFPSPVINNPYS